MSNAERMKHEYFQELCAAADLGELSQADYRELRAHLDTCDACQAEYSSLLEIQERLPLAAPKPSWFSSWLFPLSRWLPPSEKARARFLAEVNQGALQLSAQPSGAASVRENWQAFSLFCQRYAPTLAFLTVLLALGVFLIQLRQSREFIANGARETENLTRLNVELQQKLTHSALELEETRQARKKLELQLSQARTGFEEANDRAQLLDVRLQEAGTALQLLQGEAQAARTGENSVTRELQEAARNLDQLREELRQVQARQSQDADTTTSLRVRLNELSEREKALSETINRQRMLLAAGRDIRELMGARNLHIVDVFDVDGQGEIKQAFGRVFVTEGKSLIFYAFNLTNRKRSAAKYSFQAWGYEEPTVSAAQNLGIFYQDNKSQNRWLLKFDNPETLARINSIFVTVEPSGGSARPTGKKLLYAYLTSQPNHP